jgi:ketosteroid isomerase-like protein
MSQENVEILRRWYAAANHRDADAGIELIDPDIELRTAGIFPDMDSAYQGREAFVRFLYEFAEAWVDLSLEPERYVDLGTRVLVLAHFHATGRDGLEIERPFAHLWTLRDGRAVRLDAYADQREALEAVGLKE